VLGLIPGKICDSLEKRQTTLTALRQLPLWIPLLRKRPEKIGDDSTSELDPSAAVLECFPERISEQPAVFL
jgi:hypothetical protein